MGIQVGDNFDHKSKKPLDNRITYATLALMKAVTDANIYEGCEAYCAETDKYYMFKSTNTVDADTGKWRERETGGGGHEIVDSNDTALTQRDVLKFGDGFKVSDDDTNEQTVANINNMQSGDMDDIVHDLPPVTPIDLDEIVDPVPTPAMQPVHYSTDEQVIGTWIDGKPIYQKSILADFPATITNGTTAQQSTAHNIANLDKRLNIEACDAKLGTIWYQSNTMYYSDGYFDATYIYLRSNSSSMAGKSSYITLQYTKTTD